MSAKLMVDQHGAEASFETAGKADELLAKGDLEGQRTWLRILRAVEWLQDERGRDPFKVAH